MNGINSSLASGSQKGVLAISPSLASWLELTPKTVGGGAV